MNQTNNNLLYDDIDGVRKTLVLSICQAIFHYYRLTKHPEEQPNITIPELKKYPATSSEVLKMIKTLICLPYDLLSVRINLDEAQSKDQDLFVGFSCGLDEISIIHWAIELGATEVITFILDIDPGQASMQTKENERYSSFGLSFNSLPLHLASKSKQYDADLPMIERLCKLNPGAISAPDNDRKLPLHYAAEIRQLEQVKFLYQQYPRAVRVKDAYGRYPLNYCCFQDENWGNCIREEVHRYLIEQYPKALANKTNEVGNDNLYMYGWFSHNSHGNNHWGITHLVENPNLPMLKMSYEYGKAYDVFEPNTVHGLFEELIVDYDNLVYGDPEDPDNEDLIEMWTQYFGEYSGVKRTTLEWFLCKYRRLNEPNYIHGWDEALHVFQAARDTAILHSAISRVQDDFLPYIIDKFDIDLMQRDVHGRTPLVVAIYHTVFTAIEIVKDDDDSEWGSDGYYEGEEESEMYQHEDTDYGGSNNIESSDDDDDDDDDDAGMQYQGKYDDWDILKDVTLVLSSRQRPYRRRSKNEDSLKCDVISMMFTQSEDVRMEIDANSASADVHLGETANQNAAMITDSDGRLPLHIATEISLKWGDGLKSISDAHSIAVTVPDPKSGLYAFMLAAVGFNSDLNSVFRLFVKQPDVIGP